MLEHDGKAKRGHESVVRTRQRELKQSSLEEEADKPDDNNGDDDRRNVAEAVANQGPNANRAQHQKLAVSEIDNAGQSEDQRDADPHQDDHARDRETIHELLDKGHHDVVPWRPRLTLVTVPTPTRSAHRAIAFPARGRVNHASAQLLSRSSTPSDPSAVSRDSPTQPPGSPGGGFAGGCSTAHLNLSELFGSTRQTSVANVT